LLHARFQSASVLVVRSVDRRLKLAFSVHL
jgi:hypothetical protein